MCCTWESQTDTRRFEDGFLVCKGNERTPIQITNLDFQLRASLGKDRFFHKRNLDQLEKAVDTAIEGKKNVDRPLKAKTILLLIVPVPLGPQLRSRLLAHRVDSRGYLAVWAYGVGEAAFPLLLVT